MTDKFDIPFNIIDEWEDLLKNQGICSAFYAAAEWGYNKRENKTTMPAFDFSPITPPPELLDQWLEEWAAKDEVTGPQVEHVAKQAARWGYDQAIKELEAFLEKGND